MTSLRIVDTPLGGGALTQAALSGAAPPGWYTGAPIGKDEWVARCRRIASARGRWFGAISAAAGPNGARLLSRVADGRGVVVTTGQQAALFGGPWYTWFKALAARELAAELQKETGIPVVPVFWAATDDADFLEAASTVISTAHGAERLTLRQGPPSGVPMSHAVLGDEVNSLFERLAYTSGSVGDARPMAVAREAFQSGATLGGAFVQLLRSLLEGAGIVVLDASHPALAEAARPHLSRAASSARATHDALTERSSQIRAAGFDTAVEVDRELSLMFAWEDPGDGVPRKRRLTLDEAARGASGARSANVLLRPVLESLLMPTVAYLGGPGEISYFAQVSAVAMSLGVETPLILPRWSGMIVPAEVDAVMERFGIEAHDLRDPVALESRVARATLPENAHSALDALRGAVNDAVGRIDGLLTPAAADGARGQFAHRIERFERRLLAAVKRRDSDVMRSIAAARGTLYPFGQPQERALNAIPLLARHNTEVGLAIRAACTAHARRLIAGAPVPA